MKQQVPLWAKMYTREPYTELTRAVGYEGLALPEAQERMQALVAKYGKEIMVQAGEELVRLDTSTTPHMARLTDQARKLAWQMLGPPPEHKETDMIAEIMARGERLKADPKPETKPVKQNKARRATKAGPASTTKPTNDNPTPTPLMQQYRDAKERHPGMLLLFRVGDFYELFGEDAETAAKLLGLTLTTRDKTVSMAGFPHHSLETYLHKLLHAGHRVAVCEQVEDAKTVRREVTREVTRVVTPGTMTNPAV